MRLISVALAAIALTFAAPAAQAEVRTGHVDDPQDAAPTLDNGTPDDISFVSMSYDSDAGSLTVSARFYGTPSDPNANRSFPPLDFSIGKACNEAMPLSGSFAADAYWDGGEQGSGDYVVDGDGSVTLTGVPGTNHADPVLSDDHQTISVTFQHSAFVHQDWRCVTGQLGNGAHGSDQFTFFFDGFTPAPLTPAIAAAKARSALTAQFGKTFSAARPRYLACPQEQFSTLSDLPSALCAAEFRRGRTWRYVETTVVADGPKLVTKVGPVRRYLRSWRSCGKKVLRKAHLTGTLASNSRDCSTKAAAFIASAAKRGTLRHRLKISAANVDRAGFSKLSTWRCTVAHTGKTVAATCLNSLGDSFRYSFLTGRL